MVWKFDNYVRAISPYGHHLQDAVELFGQITAPTLIFWGMESFAPVPESDPRVRAIRNGRLIKVPKALKHDPFRFVGGASHDQQRAYFGQVCRGAQPSRVARAR